MAHPQVVNFRFDPYEKYSWERMARDSEFRAAIESCRGKVLGCYCAPQRCHGGVIKKILGE